MHSNVDGLVFIDANQYLDLYRTVHGKKLLKPLMEQQEHIFITEQVVEEVQRNKLQVAAVFLSDQFKGLTLRKFAVPDHLFDALGKTSGLRQKLDELSKRIDQVNADLTDAAVQVLNLISRSEDELFSVAVKATDEELQRARERKEKGNPPGKATDSLGDQITWEQLLGHCKGKSKIWVLSGDSDYCTKRFGKVFLNPSLYRDLARVQQPTPEVFCFENIDEGIRHFVNSTGVKAEALPTLEESKEIEEELRSLPSLDWLSQSARDANLVAIENAWEQRRSAAAIIAGTSKQF